MRRSVLTVFLLTANSLAAANTTIHGYVTAMSSSQAFEIDDYRVLRTGSLAFDLVKGPYPDATFQATDLRVGTELEVEGEYNELTHELAATHIKAFLDDNLHMRRFAVLEHGATLQRDGTGWTGDIKADGEIIHLDSQTRLSLKEGQTNRLTPGLAINYEGVRQVDGSIRATKLEVFVNIDGRDEQKLWRENTPRLSNDGEIVIRGVKYKLVPDAEAQSYVQRVGSKLVPGFYAQDLSGGAARRLTFQFYLVENPDFNAHAFLNGTVLVNSGVLRVLTNEAQFAAVLGHEIAHATQEHAVIDGQPQKRSLVTLVHGKGYAGGKSDSLVSGYSRPLENQADRIGLEYMVSAGYDPREAAQVWKQVTLAASSAKAGVLWNAHEDATYRRSYLLSEVRNNYSGIDLNAFVRDHEEFDVLAERFGNKAITHSASSEEVALSHEPAPMIRPGYVGPSTPLPTQPETRLGTNFVTITSTPEGASVVLNGQIIGTTPMNLPTGNVGMPFILTVRKPGFRDWTGQLVSVPGKTNLRIELFRAQ